MTDTLDSDAVGLAAYRAFLRGEDYHEAYKKALAAAEAGESLGDETIVITKAELAAARKEARAALLRAARKETATDPPRKKKTFVRKVRPE